jgi:RNA exonuclease 4
VLLLKQVQTKVAEIIEKKILVGHAIHNDLKVLYLSHPRKLTRDTSTYKPFRTKFGGGTPALKKLVEHYVGVKVQTGEHSSVQDAQAAVRLYTMFRKEWECHLIEKRQKKFADPNKKKNEESTSV